MNYHRLIEKITLTNLNNNDFNNIANFIDTLNSKEHDSQFKNIIHNHPIIPNNINYDDIINDVGPEGCYILADKLIDIANQLKSIADDDVNTAIQQTNQLTNNYEE